MRGHIQKKKVTKKIQSELSNVEASGMTYETVGEGVGWNKKGVKCLVVRKLTKELIDSDILQCLYKNRYSRYYWDYYMYRDDLYTVTQNILRVNLKDLSQDKTVWTVVTVWRDGSSRSISYDDASNILVDEIMVSFL